MLTNVYLVSHVARGVSSAGGAPSLNPPSTSSANRGRPEPLANGCRTVRSLFGICLASLALTACSDGASDPPTGDAAGPTTDDGLNTPVTGGTSDPGLTPGTITPDDPGDGSTPGATGGQGLDSGQGGTDGAAGSPATPGSGGTAAGGTGTGGATGNPTGMVDTDWSCPADVAMPQLDGVTATAIDGVPLGDGYGDGFSILEGPVWTGDALYFTHIASLTGDPPEARLMRMVPGQAATVAVEEAGANGVAIGLDGQLVIGRHADGSISTLNLADGVISPVAQLYMDLRFNSPNDLTVRSDGNIYFSDPTWQAPEPFPQAQTRVYRVDPAGAVTVIDDSLQQPNGVTLSLDESTLFVGGSGQLMQYPVMADGSVGAGQAFGNVFGADGMAMDCAGNLYAATSNGIVVVDASGAELGTIVVPGVQQPTNVAFGGANRTTLFITSLDSLPKLFQAEIGVPGMPF